MQTPAQNERKPPRTWLVPAIVAAILFIGGVTSNLVAAYVQTSLDPYRRWVSLGFGIAFIVAIATAIKETRRPTHSEASSGAKVDGKVDGDVVARDKITHIYQTTGLPATALHQLPPPVDDFTGRADELAELTAKLDLGGVTISGLQGLGGIGKTALALKLADQLKPRFPDAQFYLDLKGASREPLSVAEALSHVIRAYHPTAKLPDTDAELRGLYQSVLQDKRALLFMDNAASAEQVEPLIPPTGCVLLVTSRWHFTLPGLFAKDLEALSPEDARDLLLAIAPRIGGLADEIAGLCGCLPLALRLAGSALVKFINLSPLDYARRLNNEQRRLQLIEASLKLSYELLSEKLQRLWRLLGVFPHTFEEEAVAAVWNVEVDKAQDILGELIAASMVEWNESSRRYRMHDLARLFASSQLANEERANGQRLHATHYQTVLAATGDLYSKGGETVRGGLMLFDLEWRNIEAGQVWAEVEAGGSDQAAQLCIDYTETGVHVLNLRQHPRERIYWLKAALGAARRLKQRGSEGAALGNLGNAHAELGKARRAIEFYEQQLVIVREMGYRRGEGITLGNLGTAYADLGETRLAIEFHEQGLNIAREIGYRRGEGGILGNLGIAYKNLGETKRAIEFFEQALLIVREIGDRRGEGNTLGNLGNAYKRLGETRRGIEFLEQGLNVAREIGDRRAEGAALGSLGNAYATLGETRRALEFHEQYLAIARETGDRRGEANALFNKSLALGVLGERVQAIACAEVAFTIWEQIEDPNVAKVRAQLAMWQAGE